MKGFGFRFWAYAAISIILIILCLTIQKDIVAFRILAIIIFAALFTVWYAIKSINEVKKCSSIIQLEEELKVIKLKLESIDNSVDETKLLKRKIHLQTLIKAITGPIQ